MKTEKDLKAIVDADILRYRCGFAADSAISRQAREAYPGITQSEVDEILMETDYTGHALQNVKTVIESVVNRFHPEHTIYIQGEGNFREGIATIKPYKGNRSAHKPKYYVEIKDYLIDQWGAIPVNSQETDDAIGIMQMDNTDKYSVIVSNDKDLMTIPGWHWNWVKDELVYQTMQNANKFFFWQMLVGDTTDNIPGIDGIGVKTADKLLKDQSVEECRRIVQEQYQRQYGENWEQAYREIGTLLYILRHPTHRPDQNGCPLL